MQPLTDTCTRGHDADGKSFSLVEPCCYYFKMLVMCSGKQPSSIHTLRTVQIVSTLDHPKDLIQTYLDTKKQAIPNPVTRPCVNHVKPYLPWFRPPLPLLMLSMNMPILMIIVPASNSSRLWFASSNRPVMKEKNRTTAHCVEPIRLLNIKSSPRKSDSE